MLEAWKLTDVFPGIKNEHVLRSCDACQAIQRFRVYGLGHEPFGILDIFVRIVYMFDIILDMLDRFICMLGIIWGMLDWIFDIFDRNF